MSHTTLRFLGAAGEVTGSATLVAHLESRILVDFGLFQGYGQPEGKNAVSQELNPAGLHAVLLTHAHLDHVGRLPLLIKHGYTGQIYCTQATGEVAALILEDSVHIQMMDLERTNRRRLRAGKEALEPTYSQADVDETLKRLRAVPYDDWVQLTPQISAKWAEAGHMIGSASILLRLQAGEGGEKRVIFSGDLGPTGAPILRDPEQFRSADVVVMESTYGDRSHKPLGPTIDEFEAIIHAAVKRKARLLVPSFAVGRSQLLIYLLALMFRHGGVPKFPIFLDSPMAIKATDIYWRHVELFDEEFMAHRKDKPIRADLDTLKLCMSADESRAINKVKGPMMVIAGSGMCTGGRILHHFRHSLWKANTDVLFVGYQGEGTLGRLLVEGRDEVKIFGEAISVKATIHTLGGFSAHAGQDDLLHWLGELAPGKDSPRIILNHGEAKGREPLAREIQKRWGNEAVLPELGEVVDV